MAGVSPSPHRQPMPVLHGGVDHIAELRLSPGGLAVKTAVRIAGARMRVVLALLAVEVGPAVRVANGRAGLAKTGLQIMRPSA